MTHRLAWLGLAGLLAFGCAETSPVDVGPPKLAATGCHGGPKHCPPPDTTPAPPPDTTPAPPPDTTPAPPDTGAIDYAAIIAGIRPRGFGASPYALLTPTGGTAYTVDPAGNDANAGTSVAPFRTINRAAALARAGDVVTIRDGEYRESVAVQNSGTAAQPIVFQAEHRGGVVLTGGAYTWQAAGYQGLRGATPQRWVTLRGLIFRAYAGDVSGAVALRVGAGWTVDDCLFDAPGWAGIAVPDDSVTIVRTTIQRAGLLALNVYGGSAAGATPDDPAFTPVLRFRLLDSILRENNFANASTGQTLGGSTSVMKIAGPSRGTLIENVESTANHGSGLWLDQKSTDFVIRGNYVHDNVAPDPTQPRAGRGINLEMAWRGGVVERNVVTGNSGPGLSVVNTDHLTVRGNLFSGNRTGIELYALTGAGYEPFTLGAVRITGNTFEAWTFSPGAIWGVAVPATPQTLAVVADSNRYQPGTQSALTGGWPAPLYGATTIAEMQTKFGWEAHGSLTP